MKVYAVSLGRLPQEFGFMSDPITEFYTAKREALEAAKRSLPTHNWATVFCYKQPIRKLGDVVAMLNETQHLYTAEWEMVAKFEPLINWCQWYQTYPTHKVLRL